MFVQAFFMTVSLSGNTSMGEMGLLVSDHITAMLAYWDKDLVCRFANNAYLEWFGRTKEEMVDKIAMRDLLGPLFEKNLPHIKGALAGEIQIFEREIPLPNGTVKQSLATYTPHIENGMVQGFFVHVADVTNLKEAEKKVLRSKQDILRNVIDAQERERMSIEHVLNENVSQMLVYSKMLLSHDKHKNDGDLHEKILSSINHAIKELKNLSFTLTPTAIKHFGFINGVEDYLEHLKAEHPVKIWFEYEDDKIEALELEDKLSVFRIMQNFIMLLLNHAKAKTIGISISFNRTHLLITLSHDDNNFTIDKTSNEYTDIAQRLEYYGGTITEHRNDHTSTMKLALHLNAVMKHKDH